MKHTLESIPPAWRRTSKVFTALGDEYRQRILLSFEPGGSLTLNEIVAMSVLSRTAVAHHVRVLRDAGILVGRKRGKEVHLKIDRAVLEENLKTVLDYVHEHARSA